MNFSFKNLLAKILRPGRWGEFLEVIQDMVREIKADKMDRLRDKINLDLAGETDLEDFIDGTGFNLPKFDGYTSSLYYLRERAKGIIFEIRTKLSIESILSMYKGFLVYGSAYGVQRFSSEIWRTLYTDTEGTLITLDQEVGTALPALYLDTTEWVTLDEDVNTGFISHLVLTYGWVFAENTTQLWSPETARAFYLTLRQNKRKRDFHRFQPYLKIDLNANNTAKTWAYPVYTRDASALQKTILLTGDLSDIARIDLGNGVHTTIDLSITGCQSVIDTFTVGANYQYDFREVKTNSATTLNLEYSYTEWTKLSDTIGNQILTLTECALFDSGNNIIAYATFPEVNYTEEMLSTILFEFNIVSP